MHQDTVGPIGTSPYAVTTYRVVPFLLDLRVYEFLRKNRRKKQIVVWGGGGGCMERGVGIEKLQKTDIDMRQHVTPGTSLL